MKINNLVIILTVLATANILAATPEQIKVSVAARSERMVNGQNETNILTSSYAITTIGNEAIIRVASPFTTEVSKYSEMTRLTGQSGVMMTVTPMSTNSVILLKGVAQILKAPASQSLGDTGAIAVQEQTNIQFSLTVADGNPFKLSPIEMPDGSKLYLTFTASTELEKGMSREERERLRN